MRTSDPRVKNGLLCFRVIWEPICACWIKWSVFVQIKFNISPVAVLYVWEISVRVCYCQFLVYPCMFINRLLEICPIQMCLHNLLRIEISYLVDTHTDSVIYAHLHLILPIIPISAIPEDSDALFLSRTISCPTARVSVNANCSCFRVEWIRVSVALSCTTIHSLKWNWSITITPIQCNYPRVWSPFLNSWVSN